MLHPGTPSFSSYSLCWSALYTCKCKYLWCGNCVGMCSPETAHLIQFLLLGLHKPMNYRASRTSLGLLWNLNPALSTATAQSKASANYRWSPNWQCICWSVNFQPSETLLPVCSGGSWDNTKWQRARVCRPAQDAHSICWVLLSRGAEGNWERKHHDLSKRSPWCKQTHFSVPIGWAGDAIWVCFLWNTP